MVWMLRPASQTRAARVRTGGTPPPAKVASHAQPESGKTSPLLFLTNVGGNLTLLKNVGGEGGLGHREQRGGGFVHCV